MNASSTSQSGSQLPESRTRSQLQLQDSQALELGPQRPAPQLLLPAFSLEWAAGFVDGEGCIHIARQRHPGRRSVSHRLRVFISQNDLSVLTHLRDGMAIPAPIYQVKRRDQHRRQCFTLNYDGAQAMKVIEMLAPHLVRKRPEADAARDFWTHGRMGHRPGPKGLSPEVLRVREHYCRELQRLK